MEESYPSEVSLLDSMQPGEKLYHYTSAEAMKGICGGEFWATESSFMNDKMECKVASQVFEEIIKEKVSCQETASKIIHKVAEEVDWYYETGYLDNANFGSYIISFSMDHDSALMWSEYSDFTGYCITFDSEKLLASFKKSEDKGGNLYIHGAVVYNSQKQKEILIKIIEEDVFGSEEYEHINSWEDFASVSDEELNKACYYMVYNVYTYNLFFKLECFSGEKEYRFVLLCFHKGDTGTWPKANQCFRVRDGVLIPYVKEKFEPECIEEILVGPMQKSDIAERGVKYFIRNLGWNHNATFKTSKIPLRY